MVRNLLLILFISFSVGLAAQISYAPTPLSMVVAPTSSDTKLEIHLTNSQDTTFTIFWKLEKDASFQNGWATYVCDLNNCYFENVDKCSPNLPNSFPKGTYKFEFHFKPNGISGATNINFKLYTEKTFTNEIMGTSIALNSTTSASTKDFSNQNLRVYPNPATDYFQISNNLNVKKVVLYNMFGREIKSFFHYNNAQHDIIDLKSGMYIIKLLDDKNKVIKTVKLNKSYDGA